MLRLFYCLTRVQPKTENKQLGTAAYTKQLLGNQIRQQIKQEHGISFNQKFYFIKSSVPQMRLCAKKNKKKSTELHSYKYIFILYYIIFIFLSLQIRQRQVFLSELKIGRTYTLTHRLLPVGGAGSHSCQQGISAFKAKEGTARHLQISRGLQERRGGNPTRR